MSLVDILQSAGVILLALVLAYLIWKFYSTRVDFTYMTHNDQGFKRSLRGRGFILHPEEFIVRGPGAPNVEFVALDPASGQRKLVPLLNRRTGQVNLRPQFCVPLPFAAVTADDHQIIAEARVQFSLNRDQLYFVYNVQDFGLALETRIQSAIRAEVGLREDQQLRASLHEVEEGAVRRLRKAEEEGDEAHEMGIALGVKFHGVSFTYTAASDFAGGVAHGAPMVAGAAGGAPVEGTAVTALDRLRMQTRAGALSLTPQQVDKLADQFRSQSPQSIAAFLAVLEMQTRQNIAEALAASGQLIVVTPQELGLAGATVQGQMLSRVANLVDVSPPAGAPKS